MPKYKMIVEFVRIAEIEIEAEDGLDARSKIGNYEFDPEIIGDLTGWRVVETRQSLDNIAPTFSDDSALSLARKRMKMPK